jgi:hypothetical protein
MTQIEVTASAVIASPAARLWELVSDTSRNAEWVEATAEPSMHPATSWLRSTSRASFALTDVAAPGSVIGSPSACRRMSRNA